MTPRRPITRGRIRQSLCRWCYEGIPIDTLAREAAAMGYVAIDLVEPADWPALQRHGLVCSMTPSHTIVKGLNKRENHAECLAQIRAAIDATAAAGFPNVICFSGNREPEFDDEAGAACCVDAVKQVVGYAEAKRVTLHMELLNSKVDHPGYMCDRSAWGAEVVRRVGSDRFKLLYDIYHMQVQEGDVIASLRAIAPMIGHYHTGGVPGRHEIDDTQELYYPAIMRTILETGYAGFVAQEFVPAGDPLTALAQAAAVCDV
jgi:hydroxypyruvate isomerase